MAILKTKTLNPLQFVLGELLKTNLILISIKDGTIPDGTPVKDCMEYFRRTIPAGTSYLLFTQIDGNLTQCPSSAFSTQDMVAFHVNESIETDPDPVTSERVVTSGGPF